MDNRRLMGLISRRSRPGIKPLRRSLIGVGFTRPKVVEKISLSQGRKRFDR